MVDVRFAGEYKNLFWALSVQNVFNQHVFRLWPRQQLFGQPVFSLYPLPGRTFKFKLGGTFRIVREDIGPMVIARR